MKIKSLVGWVGLGLVALVVFFGGRWAVDRPWSRGYAAVVVEKTWQGFKARFMTTEGRVVRPRENDTVSEGQGYALLRAVWLKDKDTFDRCYRWSEQHLSRVKTKGDHLLAWRWQDGQVADWMPASDADVDYALGLLLAARLWPGQAPAGLEDYAEKAKKILADILERLTFRVPSGGLYLAPWILSAEERASFPIPINPSYYSPAHFRLFFAFTLDPRWDELTRTTYDVLNQLGSEFGGEKGVGLIPDWCAVDAGGRLHPWAEKGSAVGWEAVRVPFRVALDVHWFDRPEGRAFFARLVPFLEKEWARNQAIFCEYSYAGQVGKEYSNPLFDSAYAVALAAGGSPLHKKLSRRVHQGLIKKEGAWLFQNPDDYFINSLAWFADGFSAGVIAIPSERKIHDQKE